MQLLYPKFILTSSLLLVLATPVATAATLTASVSESGKGQLQNAVVYAIPSQGLSAAEKLAGRKIIDQIDKEFVPRVSVFQTGTDVEFPNHDNIRHHVYSFSEAKSFEIPLYKGTPSEPVRFDQPGVVDIGCNIHDWMTAQVLVTDTPYFAVSDAEGKISLNGLPNGSYNVYVWHPQQSSASESTAQRVELKDDTEQTLSFTIKKKKQWVPFRAPTRAAGSYR